MNRKEYIEKIRPTLRLILSFILYMKFGGDTYAGTTMLYSVTPQQMFPIAELFLNEFEMQFKFEDR